MLYYGFTVIKGYGIVTWYDYKTQYVKSLTLCRICTLNKMLDEGFAGSALVSVEELCLLLWLIGL